MVYYIIGHSTNPPSFWFFTTCATAGVAKLVAARRDGPQAGIGRVKPLNCEA